MANLLYDFFPGATVTPYIGAGVGAAFVDANIQGCSLCLTMFAYQGILGVSFAATEALRIGVEGRYYGTTNPGAYFNNNIMALATLSYKFGQPSAAPPPPSAPPVAPPSSNTRTEPVYNKNSGALLLFRSSARFRLEGEWYLRPRQPFIPPIPNVHRS